MEDDAHSENEIHATGVQHVMIPDDQGIPRSWTVLPKPRGLAYLNLQEEMGLADEPGDVTEAGTQIYQGIWRKVRYEFNAAMPNLDDDHPPLWEAVPSSVKSDVQAAKPYMKRFAGGWATEAIMLDILRNARDTAARRRAGKLKARGGITGKRSKSNQSRVVANAKKKVPANAKKKAPANRATQQRANPPPNLDAPGLHSITNDSQADGEPVPPGGTRNGAAPVPSGEPASRGNMPALPTNGDSGTTWNTYVDQELAEIRAARPTQTQRKKAGPNSAFGTSNQAEPTSAPTGAGSATQGNNNPVRPRPKMRAPPAPSPEAEAGPSNLTARTTTRRAKQEVIEHAEALEAENTTTAARTQGAGRKPRKGKPKKK